MDIPSTGLNNDTFGGWGGDLISTVGNVLGTGISLYNQFTSNQAPGQPGDLAGFDLAGGDPWTRTLFNGPGGTTYRPATFHAPDPSGRLHFFGPMGRPVLWSKDFAAAKRVARIARRAGGTVRRRSSSRRRGGR